MSDFDAERVAREFAADFGRYMGDATVELVGGEMVLASESLRLATLNQLRQAAAAEREACAKVADDRVADIDRAFKEKRVTHEAEDRCSGEHYAATEIAEEIRERGEKGK